MRWILNLLFGWKCAGCGERQPRGSHRSRYDTVLVDEREIARLRLELDQALKIIQAAYPSDGITQADSDWADDIIRKIGK